MKNDQPAGCDSFCRRLQEKLIGGTKSVNTFSRSKFRTARQSTDCDRLAGSLNGDEATAVPVDYEAVPWDVEYKDMMTAPVEREAVPRPVSQSEVRSRPHASRGLAGRSDAGLILLRGNASRLFGAFRSCTRRLSAAVRS
jgi:hypothetical protein